MKRQLELSLGALSPPIAQQMQEQGLMLAPGQDVNLLQKDADALTRCAIRGLIPDSQVRAGRQKLVKVIARLVLPGGNP